ncbi:Condensin complex subunit 2 [Entamoeba marina]
MNTKSSDVLSLYTNCIQLCNTNKLNKTNAWNVPLIDILEDVIHEEDGNNAFQTASTSIDASLMVYSCRVDSIYQAINNLASSIVNVNTENEIMKEEGCDDLQKKKTLKNTKTLETNPNALLSKSTDKNYIIDPLLRYSINKNINITYHVGYGGVFKGDWKETKNIIGDNVECVLDDIDIDINSVNIDKMLSQPEDNKMNELKSH